MNIYWVVVVTSVVSGLLAFVFALSVRRTLHEEIAIFGQDGLVTYYGYDEPYGQAGDVWFHEPSGHRYVYNGNIWVHACEKPPQWKD
jgi:hypothetical protein